ncbi:hypothetical protein GGR52DRAFT_567470 [Hypoxylon sp. FL1284]|nr:hypothetical protein GGR52DRAFT_567470 [Hypoxylon sp. FL1284]
MVTITVDVPDRPTGRPTAAGSRTTIDSSITTTTTTAGPESTSSPNQQALDSEVSVNHIGLVVGIVFAGLFGIMLAAAGFIWHRRIKKRRRARAAARLDEEQKPGTDARPPSPPTLVGPGELDGGGETMIHEAPDMDRSPRELPDNEVARPDPAEEPAEEPAELPAELPA